MATLKITFHNQHMVVPVFSWPYSTWQALSSSIDDEGHHLWESGTTKAIVVDADISPGAPANTDYTNEIQEAVRKGLAVYGYVRTGYAESWTDAQGNEHHLALNTRRKWQDVVADIDAWYLTYGALGFTGIFLDMGPEGNYRTGVINGNSDADYSHFSGTPGQPSQTTQTIPAPSFSGITFSSPPKIHELYKWYRAYIGSKAQGGVVSGTKVWLNAASCNGPDDEWVLKGAADVATLFEDDVQWYSSGGVFPGGAVPSWFANYRPEQICHIVLNLPKLTSTNSGSVRDALWQAIAISRTFGAAKPGFLYFNDTDATYKNTPSFWDLARLLLCFPDIRVEGTVKWPWPFPPSALKPVLIANIDRGGHFTRVVEARGPVPGPPTEIVEALTRGELDLREAVEQVDSLLPD